MKKHNVFLLLAVPFLVFTQGCWFGFSSHDPGDTIYVGTTEPVEDDDLIVDTSDLDPVDDDVVFGALEVRWSLDADDTELYDDEKVVLLLRGEDVDNNHISLTATSIASEGSHSFESLPEGSYEVMGSYIDSAGEEIDSFIISIRVLSGRVAIQRVVFDGW